MNSEQRDVADGKTRHGLPRVMIRTFLVQISLNGLAPLGVYLIARLSHVGVVFALVLSGIVPALAVVVKFLRSRKFDTLGLLTLLVIVIGSCASLAFANPRFILAKESIITGALSIFLLVSLLAPKPGMFHLWRLSASMMKGQERMLAWDRKWTASAAFRHSQRLLTGALGVLCLLEAASRVALTAVLPPAAMLVVSQLLPLVFLAAAFPWMLHVFNKTWETDTIQETKKTGIGQ